VYFRVALVVLVSLGAGFACRDAGSGSAGVTTTSAGPAGAVYLARPDDQWTLKEAYNPLPENTLTRTVEPSLDWYAEYEAPPANSPRRVRLSGHSSGVDQVAAELKGFTLEPAIVGSYKGLAGVSSDPIGPSAVVFAVRADFSVIVLSYELPVEGLLAWTDGLKTVTESEWTETGGRVER
jgi:hypothetical protein